MYVNIYVNVHVFMLCWFYEHLLSNYIIDSLRTEKGHIIICELISSP